MDEGPAGGFDLGAARFEEGPKGACHFLVTIHDRDLDTRKSEPVSFRWRGEGAVRLHAKRRP